MAQNQSKKSYSSRNPISPNFKTTLHPRGLKIKRSMSAKDIFGKGLTFKTEVTNGDCPTCHSRTVFVSLYKNVYRCVACGTDNEQKS